MYAQHTRSFACVLWLALSAHHPVRGTVLLESVTSHAEQNFTACPDRSALQLNTTADFEDCYPGTTSMVGKYSPYRFVNGSRAPDLITFHGSFRVRDRIVKDWGLIQIRVRRDARVAFCFKEQRHDPLLNLTVNKAQCGRKKNQLPNWACESGFKAMSTGVDENPRRGELGGVFGCGKVIYKDIGSADNHTIWVGPNTGKRQDFVALLYEGFSSMAYTPIPTLPVNCASLYNNGDPCQVPDSNTPCPEWVRNMDSPHPHHPHFDETFWCNLGSHGCL